MKLIPLTERVIHSIYQWNLDEKMRKSIGGMSIESTLEEIKAYYAYTYDGKSGTGFGIELDSGTLIGCFLLEHIEVRHKRGWLHLVFEPGNERHILKATQKFLNFIFIENDFKMLMLMAPKSNIKIQKFIEKVGFKRKCIIPEYFLFQDGWEHGIFYTMKKTERKL